MYNYIYIYIHISEYCQRVLSTHPSIRGIAKQPNATRNTFEEQGIQFEKRIFGVQGCGV